jgi:group I intron endonuclease
MTILSGIYSITNTINGKVYYGSSNNIIGRFGSHKKALKYNIHGNRHLQFSWNKYGPSAFKFDIVKEVPVEQLFDVEQSYLDKCKETPDLYYNISYSADCPNRGRKMKPFSEEHRRKLSEWQLGKPKWSEEQKRQMSLSRLGTVESQEHKDNISNALKGKPKSEEHNAHVSAALMGRKLSAEHISRLCECHGMRDREIYTFKNTSTNETFTGMKSDFYKQYNFHKSGVCRLIQRKIKIHRGWIVV